MNNTIQLNGNAHLLSVQTTLADLLISLSLQNKRIAIEVNQEIIPRSEYPIYILQDKDQVEIVHAIGGG